MDQESTNLQNIYEMAGGTAGPVAWTAALGQAAAAPEPAAAAATAQVSSSGGTCFPLAELQAGCPAGVPPTQKEYRL